MRALSIDEPGRARVIERPDAKPSAGEVLLEVAYAGLCGTDLSTFLGKNPNVTIRTRASRSSGTGRRRTNRKPPATWAASP